MQASFSLRGHNPDVLSCIANLSNDEVFTPPELVNWMLDDIEKVWSANHDGELIWSNPEVTFLDPCTKSGVFLREVVRRLVDSQQSIDPDLDVRVNRILGNQVFGIGITQLTALISRRTIYCSKFANGEHSVYTDAAREAGNLWFERSEHSWEKGRCRECGASQAEYDRGPDLESHAYRFLHGDCSPSGLSELFGGNVQFDVIIGNPPYQLSDGGDGGSARPLYHLFMKQAISLDPRYICMVTPSRWFQGGKGLGNFRAEMLNSDKFVKIVDFLRDRTAFPNVNINGGVNYFLWGRNHHGPCEIVTVEEDGERSTPELRSLAEFDVFVRRNSHVRVLRKVLSSSNSFFSQRVSSTKPFGLRTFYHGAASRSIKTPIMLHGSGRVSWVSMDEIPVNQELVAKWKVLVPAASDGNENPPLPIWDKRGPFIAGPGEACTETYLIAAVTDTEEDAERIVAYMRTKFFRFLVSLRKVAQHNKAENFDFVPDIVLDDSVSDGTLYALFGLSDNEVEIVESSIRSVAFGE